MHMIFPICGSVGNIFDPCFHFSQNLWITVFKENCKNCNYKVYRKKDDDHLDKISV